MQKCTRRIIFLLGFLLLAGSLFAQPGTISTVAGGGTGGDGGPATSAQIGGPYAVAVDSAGNLYIADWRGNRIRKVSIGTGIITTIAGTGAAHFDGDGGPATDASLNSPEDVAVDSAGNVYIVDSHNNRVRKVSAGSGVISTIAGTGVAGYNGEGSATSAMLNDPAGVAVDSSGNVYIADQSNHRVRKVTPSGSISTVAGAGSAGFSGDGGSALAAQINNPVHLATDASGNIYIADYYNNRVRKVNAGGIITTIAGSSPTPKGGFSGDGGPATAATLTNPTGVAVDSAGNIYISDGGNQRVRKIDPSGIIQTIAGGGKNGDGCLATTSSLSFPFGVALGPSQTTLYIADFGDDVVRAVSLGGSISAPNLTLLSPSSGVMGTTNSVTITGSGFSVNGGNSSCSSGPMNVSITGVGVSLSDVTPVSDTSISMTVTIASGAAAGAYNVSVTNANGTSNALPFTVTPPTPAPTLQSISPSNGLQGSKMTVTLTGANFDTKSGGTTVSVSGGGITISNITVASASSLTATFSIDVTAATGKHNVTASTSQGTSNTVAFTVVALPTITSISPAAGLRGTNAVVTINGTNFNTSSGATQVSVGNGITVSKVNVISPSSLTATLTIAPDAPLGSDGVSVTTSVGTSNTMNFAVNPQGPTFTYGLPETLDPTQQAPLQLSMTAPSPDPVTGQVTFTFASNAAGNMDDPNVTFISAQASSRTVNFTIPANTTTAQFSMPDAVLHAGTVAGMIQLTTDQVQVAGQSVTPSNASFNVTVPRTVPTIINVRLLNRTSKGFDVEVTGYSDSEDISQAAFDFSAKTGQKLETVQLQPDVTSIFSTYYQSSSEPMAGGAFVYTQPFIAKQGDANVVASVTVTLTNAQGTSQPKSAP